jgi:hypothetical protein
VSRGKKLKNCLNFQARHLSSTEKGQKIFFFTVKLALSSEKLKEKKEFFKLSQACHLSSTAQRQNKIYSQARSF